MKNNGVLQWLNDNFEKTVCAILMIVMALTIFIQVVARYAFNSSLSWSEELARFIFVWLVYLGISYGCKQMKHLKIDAALYLFPKKIRPIVMIIGDCLFLVFAIYQCVTGFQLMMVQIQFHKVSSALHCPMWVVNAAAVVGMGLAAFREVQVILYRIKTHKEGVILES